MVRACPSSLAQHRAPSVPLSSAGLPYRRPVHQCPRCSLLSCFSVVQHLHLPGTGALTSGGACPASLACTLQLQPSSHSQLAGNVGLGVSSLLCFGQVPAPRMCQHQQGLNPAPCMGLGYAYNPHTSPKPNNTSWSPLGWAYLQINNSHTSISLQSYLHLCLTGSALNAGFAWLF